MHTAVVVAVAGTCIEIEELVARRKLVVVAVVAVVVGKEQNANYLYEVPCIVVVVVVAVVVVAVVDTSLFDHCMVVAPAAGASLDIVVDAVDKAWASGVSRSLQQVDY